MTYVEELQAGYSATRRRLYGPSLNIVKARRVAETISRKVKALQPAKRSEPASPIPDGIKLPTRPIALIQYQVCRYFGVSKFDLLGARRTKPITRVRHLAVYLAKEMTGKSLPEIGRAFGRDHTTILHSVRVGEKLKELDPAFATDLEEIRKAVVEAS